MSCPFPGMDPYLEDETFWTEFHHGLVTNLYQMLVPGLVDRYRAGVAQRHYALDPSSSEGGAAECREEYVDVRERESGRLVTRLDVLSPVNKTTEAGRKAYLDTRHEGKASGGNLVEIDLVLQGRPTLEYSRDGLPDWDFAVTVTRSTQPERYEIYTATLQKKLPRFRLPLAADDRDTVLDLQAAFTRSYDQGGFAARIDYGREPLVGLKEEKRLLAIALIENAKGAAPRSWEDVLSREKIAARAYALWQQDGCPHGRDKDHWYEAVERLKRRGEAVT